MRKIMLAAAALAIPMSALAWQRPVSPKQPPLRTTPVNEDEIGRRKSRIAEVGRMESVKRAEFNGLFREFQAIPLKNQEDCLRRAILRNRLADLGTEIDTLRVRQVQDAEMLLKMEPASQ